MPRKPKSAAPVVEDRIQQSKTWHRIGEILQDEEGIPDEQLAQALLRQKTSGRRLGTVLMAMGLTDESAVAVALARQSGFELIDLGATNPDPQVATLMPESIARSLNAVCIRRDGESVLVAVSDPADSQLLDQLHRVIGKDLEIVVATPSDVRATINRVYRALGKIDEHVKAFQAKETIRAAPAPSPDGFEDAPVVRIVDLLIAQAFRDRASDIHIEPQEHRLRIRYRIDGVLHDTVELPEDMKAALVSRVKIMAKMNIVERHRPQDGQIAMEIDGRSLDVRVSTTPTIWGEKAVLRLLDKSKPLFRLDDLGLAPDVQDRYNALIRGKFGMVICAGPTGSGKTTSLYATLNEINSSELNIMTVEDPVEYVFPSINQIQIREQSGIGFADGLRSILRQDPDIILVGEIRDVETARIAVQSALTGHFVLSSIHATDAVSALHRFLDMGMEAFLIASAVTGVIGQRLVRRVCVHCRIEYKPSAEEVAFLQEWGGNPKTKLHRGEGCSFCSNTGYQDRVGVFELLTITDEMRQLIVRHASIDKLSAQAVKQGMRPMRREAMRLVEEGVTTITELLRTIYA